MSVLVDTSVWVAHFKHTNEHLVELLNAGWVVCHPHVLVEIALGTPPSRAALIEMLGELESVPVAAPAELLSMIGSHGLQGRGCGLVDISLLASALLADQTLLWTFDKRLEALAVELARCYRPALQS